MKNNFLKLALFLTFLVGISPAALAEPEILPVPGNGNAVEANVPARVQLKAPIETELTEEEKAKAAEEARIKAELAEEQKQIGEAEPLKVEDKDFDPNSNEMLTQDVVPNTGMELIKLISMFARVMLGVIIATGIIYFLLIFTKKYFHPPLPEKGEEDFDVRDLNSPKTADEALKSFLDRTGE